MYYKKERRGEMKRKAIFRESDRNQIRRGI